MYNLAEVRHRNVKQYRKYRATHGKGLMEDIARPESEAPASPQTTGFYNLNNFNPGVTSSQPADTSVNISDTYKKGRMQKVARIEKLVSDVSPAFEASTYGTKDFQSSTLSSSQPSDMEQTGPPTYERGIVEEITKRGSIAPLPVYEAATSRPSTAVYMNDFQDPELSSSLPLDMERRWIM
jgi:hypothetical protein